MKKLIKNLKDFCKDTLERLVGPTVHTVEKAASTTGTLLQRLFAVIGKFVWYAVVCASKLVEIAWKGVVKPAFMLFAGLIGFSIAVFAVSLLVVFFITNPLALLGFGACYCLWSLAKPRFVAWFTDEWPEVDDDKEVVVATERTAPREWKEYESFESVKDSFQKC